VTSRRAPGIRARSEAREKVLRLHAALLSLIAEFQSVLDVLLDLVRKMRSLRDEARAERSSGEWRWSNAFMTVMCPWKTRSNTCSTWGEFVSLRNMFEMMFGQSVHYFNRSYYSWLYEDLSFVWSNSQWKCYGRGMNLTIIIFSVEKQQNLNPGAGLKKKSSRLVHVHIKKDDSWYSLLFLTSNWICYSNYDVRCTDKKKRRNNFHSQIC